MDLCLPCPLANRLNRLVEGCSTGVREAFIYDHNSALLKQSSLMPPGAARVSNKRRVVRKAGSAAAADPSMPRMVHMEDLRSLLLQELPEGTA